MLLCSHVCVCMVSEPFLNSTNRNDVYKYQVSKQFETTCDVTVNHLSTEKKRMFPFPLPRPNIPPPRLYSPINIVLLHDDQLKHKEHCALSLTMRTFEISSHSDTATGAPPLRSLPPPVSCAAPVACCMSVFHTDHMSTHDEIYS